MSLQAHYGLTYSTNVVLTFIAKHLLYALFVDSKLHEALPCIEVFQRFLELFCSATPLLVWN
jgi:hypothetical protein